MKLLVLSSRPPWPPERADQMTVDRLVRFLVERDNEVDLACFVASREEDHQLRSGLGTVCRRIETIELSRWKSYIATARSLPTRLPMQVGYFESRAMSGLIRRMLETNDYELIYTHLIRMAEYTRHLRLPKAIGLQISQALNYRRMVEHAPDPARRAFYRFEELKVRPYEAELCGDYDRVFLVGQRDIDELARTCPVRNAVVCPHGQDIPAASRVRAAEREPGAIVLSGYMATNTNVDAATWFARNVFPRIETECPKAKFYIVGRKPSAAVQALMRPEKVIVTGEVPDVYDWLLRAEVAVDPLRMGAGMQNKIVQAMAAELPVVATTIANEGIGAQEGTEILLRDDPDSFAQAVVELLRDSARRERIGRAARQFVSAHWTWEAHFERMLEELQRVAGHLRPERRSVPAQVAGGPPPPDGT